MSDFNHLGTAARVLKREGGYYWVKFPYPSGETHWEIGSYDSKVGLWALIGSRDQWAEFQLREVGPRIQEPGDG